jgi:hypothetical protein
MRWHLRYLTYGAVLIMGVLIGSELSVTRIWSEPDRSAQTVTRVPKGDRLPLILRPALNPDPVNLPGEIIFPHAPVFDSKLLEGCESVVSSTTQSSLVHMAGRCLS